MPRSYRTSDIKLLWYRSGGRCALLDCKTELSLANTNHLFGQMAHIVALSTDGPRGDRIFPDKAKNKYENLILLCPKHHAIVDSAETEWPSEKLLKIKEDHENWVRERLSWRESNWEDIHKDSQGYKRQLFIFAGPSGVGKDVLLSRVWRTLNDEGIKAAKLKKFTTRSKRPEEITGDTFEYLSQDEFRAGIIEGKISCIHPGFGNFYGFDSQFSLTELADTTLVSMQNLTFIEDVKTRSRACGVSTKAILLTADRSSLEKRILQRTAPDKEKIIRIQSTTYDLEWIRSHKKKIKDLFEMSLLNSDQTPIKSVEDKLLNLINAEFSKGIDGRLKS